MRDDGTVSDTFASRFAVARSGPGPLVWGLDPSTALLKAWGLGDDPDGLDRFADMTVTVMDSGAVADTGEFSESVTSAVKLKVPPLTGVPVMLPVEACSESPGGSDDPSASDQV